MIAWNSQMALDARQHLFLIDANPDRVWHVTNSEGKHFILKRYRVDEEMDAVRAGYYMESKFLPDPQDPEYDPDNPERGTEWAFMETSLESFLAHFETVEELE